MNSLVYFDSCCFIDMAQAGSGLALNNGRESHVDFCRLLLETAQKGEIKVYTSTLSVAECTKVTDLSKPDGQQAVLNEHVKTMFRGMLLSGLSGVLPVLPTPRTSELARDLRWVHGLKVKPMDALHLATAKLMGCQHFVTTDGKLDRDAIQKSLGLNVCTADKLKMLVPDSLLQHPLVGMSKKEKAKELPPVSTSFSNQRPAPTCSPSAQDTASLVTDKR